MLAAPFPSSSCVCLPAARRLVDPTVAAGALSSMGGIAARLGDTRGAIGHYEEAASLLSSEPDHPTLAEIRSSCCRNLGRAYLAVYEYAKASDCFQSFLDIEGGEGRGSSPEALPEQPRRNSLGIPKEFLNNLGIP